MTTPKLIAMTVFTERINAEYHAHQMREQGYSARIHTRQVSAENERVLVWAVVVRETRKAAQ